MRLATAKAALNLVQRLAQHKFGKHGWKQRLAERYCEIDSSSTVSTRRKHIDQVFERESCNADTLFILLACVDCEVKITRIVEEEFLLVSDDGLIG